MKLVIVESPAKAKTIEKYLGEGYTVKASIGHIRDLPKSNKKAIDIENGFAPHYEVAKGKEKVIDELIGLTKKSEEVILATDLDREGEAIAWHLQEVLGLTDPKRIVFNEITESAVREAVAHPRLIDQNLRYAQEARRVLDRLVGYDLSGLIWKKLRYGLSAGRVQSPSLRIIMERERKIRAFVPEDFWTITAEVKNATAPFTLLCAEEPRDKKEVDRIVSVGKGGTWKVQQVKESEVKRQPKPPFTTSALQQTASSRLGYSPSNTMRIAQKLYESGLITYMRTDSTNLSDVAKKQIKEIVSKEYGGNYFAAHIYKSKSKKAQEAHECIRPADISKMKAGKTEDQKKLYNLIWARTVASQMADSKILRTKMIVGVNEGEIPNFSINGSRILFDGWFKGDPASRGEENELPEVTKNETLTCTDIHVEDKQTQPPGRYTEAGLVKELEKRDIGRPSTYAAIMKTLVDRGYVEKQGRTLFPTDTGDVVSSFLEKHFDKYISDSFTAEMEDELDEIAAGKREYSKTLEEFYKPFSEDVKSKEDIEKISNLGDAPDEFKCPKCGKKMIYKLSKSGKFMSCATFPDCNGARTVDGEELEGPKEIDEECPKCGKSRLMERDGRYGRFIACASYPKCKYVRQDEEQAKKALTGVKCNVCNKGEMMERRGRFGLFYSCSEYPDCKHAIKAKPTGHTCSHEREEKGGVCGALMMDGTKTIPERCSDKSCPNHNPHKLDKRKK